MSAHTESGIIISLPDGFSLHIAYGTRLTPEDAAKILRDAIRTRFSNTDLYRSQTEKVL